MSAETSTDFEPYLAPSRGERAGRRVEIATALASIGDGARVYIGNACSVPLQLLDEVIAERGRWSDLEIVFGIQVAEIPLMQHAGAPFRFTTLQPNPNLRAASDADAVTAIPARISDVPTLFTPLGVYPVDAVLVQVSAPGPEGRFSLGTSIGLAIDAVRSAPLVIAQVNQEMPYTFGAGELRRDEFDYLVEMDGPLVELKRAPPGPVEEAIAEQVVALVPDEATLQFGIGAVPEAMSARLGQRRDLGMHSGMISDGVIELVESGALTDRRKSMDRGTMITGELMGTRRLFDWAHRNPLVRMAPPAYTHGLAVLSRCHRFTAINSAVEVSQYGDVNGESIAGRLISGPGGQPDFAEGALRCAEGPKHRGAAVDGCGGQGLADRAAGGHGDGAAAPSGPGGHGVRRCRVACPAAAGARRGAAGNRPSGLSRVAGLTAPSRPSILFSVRTAHDERRTGHADNAD